MSHKNSSGSLSFEFQIDFANFASAAHEERTIFCEDINASGDSMERRKEAMPISSLGQGTLTENTRVNSRRSETPMINLLLGPLAALLVWLLVGGWFYFFGFPSG
jgi:hypothetical protein